VDDPIRAHRREAAAQPPRRACAAIEQGAGLTDRQRSGPPAGQDFDPLLVSSIQGQSLPHRRRLTKSLSSWQCHIHGALTAGLRRGQARANLLATIRRWLIEDRSAPRNQRHTARRVSERLVDEEGATVAEPTVRRAVARIRRELDLEQRDVVIVALRLPGEEAQVDFGFAEAIIAGVRTRISLFHLRLSHSGESVTVAYPTEGQEALREGHAIAFERLGGVPAMIRHDNAHSLVPGS